MSNHNRRRVTLTRRLLFHKIRSAFCCEIWFDARLSGVGGTCWPAAWTSSSIIDEKLFVVINGRWGPVGPGWGGGQWIKRLNVACLQCACACIWIMHRSRWHPLNLPTPPNFSCMSRSGAIAVKFRKQRKPARLNRKHRQTVECQCIQANSDDLFPIDQLIWCTVTP